MLSHFRSHFRSHFPVYFLQFSRRFNLPIRQLAGTRRFIRPLGANAFRPGRFRLKHFRPWLRTEHANALPLAGAADRPLRAHLVVGSFVPGSADYHRWLIRMLPAATVRLSPAGDITAASGGVGRAYAVRG